jgi:hypothetical protein
VATVMRHTLIETPSPTMAAVSQNTTGVMEGGAGRMFSG